jgi:hypothetical protein
MNTNSITGRIPKDKRQPIFLPRFTCLPARSSPLCRPTLGDSVVKRCCTNLIHTIGHRKNLPTSEITQWHEQFTRATLWRFTGKGGRPLTRSPESATNNHQHMSKLLHCSNPSRWLQPPRVTRLHSHNDLHVPLDVITQANTLGITLNLTMMMNQ